MVEDSIAVDILRDVGEELASIVRVHSLKAA